MAPDAATTTTTRARDPVATAVEDAEDVVPGTVYLVDLHGRTKAKHAGGGHRDILLVPAPSSDPDDPLNWAPSRKALSMACMCVYTLMVGIASAAIYSVLEDIAAATGLTLADLNAGTGYMFLALGWGCLVWQPLALQYGKRPVYLFSLLATLAVLAWAPVTVSNGQWIANKTLQGFFGAPIESLCEISVTDVYFQHERGAYIGLYALLLAGSSFLAPIMAGWIAQEMGWEWVLYWCAIFCAVGFVFCFFFMEETKYSRGVMVGHEVGHSGIDEVNMADAVDGEKKCVGPEAEPAVTPTSKAYWDKVKLWRAEDVKKPKHLAVMVSRPLVFLSFPVIFYAGLSYGSNLVWFNVLNGTSSLILATRYGFSSGLVGTSYISPLIGVALGSLYTGPIGDRIVLWMARRNDGVAEPEHRLWLFLPSLALVPFGLILWGVGAAHKIHWFGCVFAMGVIALTNTIGLQLSVSYCIDSYKDLAGEAVVTVILVRNTMSFAVGYGLTPWVDGMGLQNAFLVAALAGLAQCLTFLLFVRYGKGFRRTSAPRYARYVGRMASTGLVR
ncbi:hypothetical protein P8C59_003798 [Phyllachora maydis]|uniref:Major facilitator superfamily (MFS) profile domain-containing protein n=1 Tax=Phyllachora maydis TaxID=1825666 RepID=A0AAD9MBS4_9PEZI|nr:hypothetical protein P8C59_003798 [Phyllachora maydis]